MPLVCQFLGFDGFSVAKASEPPVVAGVDNQLFLGYNRPHYALAIYSGFSRVFGIAGPMNAGVVTRARAVKKPSRSRGLFRFMAPDVGLEPTTR